MKCDNTVKEINRSKMCDMGWIWEEEEPEKKEI